jgi:hypothetical protein
MSEENNEQRIIRCPHCQSEQVACWDEEVEWFEDITKDEDDDFRYFEFPVGYFKCICGKTFIHWDAEDGIVHLGSYEDAFGYDDEW